VVRVDVDEPGGDDVAVGLELALAAQAGGDGGDPTVGDADVGADAFGAGAVDDRATSDDELSIRVRHGSTPWCRAVSRSSSGTVFKILSRRALGPPLRTSRRGGRRHADRRGAP